MRPHLNPLASLITALCARRRLSLASKISHTLRPTIDKTYIKNNSFYEDKPEKPAKTSAPKGVFVKMFKEAMQHSMTLAQFIELVHWPVDQNYSGEEASLAAAQSSQPSNTTEVPPPLMPIISSETVAASPSSSATADKGKRDNDRRICTPN
ncbi:hypothetical protein VNO78_18130 [Psophocarpus tetragonolobus]|uniref:Uncharacterized protein n=1 Tax=Psophocarpus tetragonolobus TaxID=3891 RepID=A0AAN9SJ90_PSOTE